MLTRNPDQCSSTFNGCNSAFLACNIAACDAIPSVFDPESGGDIQPGYIPCLLTAKIYDYAVTTSDGDAAIKSATAEYCDCDCTDTTLTACGANCVDLLTGPNNCGSCNFYCPSGGCTNGACSLILVAAEPAQTLAPMVPAAHAFVPTSPKIRASALTAIHPALAFPPVVAAQTVLWEVSAL
jgi:hypothetical protein